MDTSKKTLLRAIIYARVSTDEQADKGYSLPTQVEACRKYADRLGFAVVAEFSEDCSGTIPISERPEGKKAVALLKRREADAIIGYQVDRLSRDIVDLLAQVRDWVKSGIQVHACDIGRVESELDIVLVIKGWQGSDERKKIIERTTRGRNGKAMSGKVVGSGRVLYGYSYSDGRFIINDIEAQTVRLIYHWYVVGDEDGNKVSEWMITKKLSELAIPTPSESGGRARQQRKTRANGMWSIATVHLILTNEAYAGTWRFGKKIGRYGKGGTRPIGEQISVEIPAIVDRETWSQAQLRRVENKRMAKRNEKHHNYLLRGMVKCGCGSAMYGYSKMGRSRRHIYYRCGQLSNRFAGIETICPERATNGQALEAFAWDYVYEKTKTAEDFEVALRLAQREEEDSLAPKREQLETVLEQVAETEREAGEIAEALKRVSRGGAVEKKLLADMERVEVLYARRIKRRDELGAALASRKYTESNISAAMQFRLDVIEGMENATLEDKRRAFEFLNAKVVVNGKRASIKCLIPGEAGQFEFNTCRGVPARSSRYLVLQSPLIDLTPYREAYRAGRGSRLAAQ